MAVKRVLLIGEAGVGKTTMTNNLKDSSEPSGATGKVAHGITKEIRSCRCQVLLDGDTLVIFDCPGIGDGHVTPVALARLIEETMKSKNLSFHGIIVATAISSGRMSLGAQVVRILVDKCFTGLGEDAKWQSVIMCGTKSDRGEDGDLQCFHEELVPAFFEGLSPHARGQAVAVSHFDYSPLLAAIQELPAEAQLQLKDGNRVSEAIGQHVLGPSAASEAASSSSEAQRALEQAQVEFQRQQREIARLREEQRRQEEEHRRALQRAEAELEQQRRLQQMRREAQAMFDSGAISVSGGGGWSATLNNDGGVVLTIG